MECETCASDTERNAQDNEQPLVHPALQTQEEGPPPPTFESSNAPDIVEIQQNVTGDTVRETINQEDEKSTPLQTT
jgi:hypothetical protein